MRYIPPFSRIRNELQIRTSRGKLRVDLSYDQFLGIIRAIIATADVDEAWYLNQYADVAEAVRSGVTATGRRHFIDNGYIEGRMPFPVQVDEAWYLAQNPDVAEDVRAGQFPSAQAHFEAFGYREGRLPFPIP